MLALIGGLIKPLKISHNMSRRLRRRLSYIAALVIALMAVISQFHTMNE